MKLPLNNIEIILSRIRKQLTETGFATSLPLNTPDKKYSLMEFVLGEGNERKALISAGIHGDEPSEDDQIGNEIMLNVKNIMPINLNNEIDGRSAKVGYDS
jgi:hypothetical protein